LTVQRKTFTQTLNTSPNPYISRRLNNMNKVQVIKNGEGYKKIAEVANTMITEIEGSILMVSINNRTTNAMNILGISEDL